MRPYATRNGLALLGYIVNDGTSITESQLARKLGITSSSLSKAYQSLIRGIPIDGVIVRKKVFRNTVYESGILLNPRKDDSLPEELSEQVFRIRSILAEKFKQVVRELICNYQKLSRSFLILQKEAANG